MKRFEETEAQYAQRVKAFSYHRPVNEYVSNRLDKIRAKCSDLAFDLNTMCPPSRELSIAQTKLEEVMASAIAAVIRNDNQ